MTKSSENRPVLHERLITGQSDAELERKANKAYRPAIWTQEDTDLAKRRACRLMQAIEWE